jgi:cytochrome c oxidase cbb3-type subunit 3
VRPALSGIVLSALLSALLAGCEREARRLDAPPKPAVWPVGAPASSLHAGPATAGQPTEKPGPGAPPEHPPEQNAYAVAQGKRLFRWYNCNGCHSAGGGGMGPPLMDDQWLYGSGAQEIVATIVQGRPNGMPSFAGRIPEDQLWQLAAYVRSMSGLVRGDIASGRSDGLNAAKPEQGRKPREAPRTTSPTREP